MPALFATTLTLAAILLFSVQPMVAKLLLPRFGGAPAVWTTCMVFFQAALLAGYGYAHATATWLGGRRQAALHVALLLVPLAYLPIAIPRDYTPPADADPAPRLLGLLLATAGLPFFAVATHAPLLQKWYSGTAAAGARDPYFLYAASNLGSMLALLGYPALIEPHLTLPQQARWWTAGYALLVALASACALVAWRTPAPPDRRAGPDDRPGPGSAIGARTAARWVALAFVPSSLMLGVTSYLSSDIAPVPMMWVVPLALYLLSYILAFARLPPAIPRAAALALPAVVLAQVFLLLNSTVGAAWALFAAHLLTFFVAAFACHAELARIRPTARHLTGFYLAMSAGGALGGLFNALVAPRAFSMVAEYPLMMAAACALMPRRRPAAAGWDDVAVPAALGLVAVATLYGWGSGNPALRLGIPLALCATAAPRPARFGLGLAAIVLVGLAHIDAEARVVHRERDFFGVLRVTSGYSNRSFALYNGNVRHGVQNRSPDIRVRRLPLAYYFPTGPIGQVFRSSRRDQRRRPVAVIGLGVGSLAGYGEPGQEFTFFEIDPAVERIARDTSYFTYLRDSPARCRVVLGDARLSLRREPRRRFTLIVVDAFSGDAIPIHLLTLDAVELYLDKLADGGLIAFHISNSYLDLESVTAALARDLRLAALIQDETLLGISEEDRKRGKTASVWVVMARRPADLAGLARDPRWRPLSRPSGVPAWTDNFSDILGALRWN